MKNLCLLCAIAALLAGCVAPQELITDRNNRENWEGKVEFAPQYDRGNGPTFMLYGKYPTPLIYKKYFEISPEKTYTYQVSFRSLDAKFPASAYMGFYLYDSKMRSITFRNVHIMKNTESEVVSARKGDKFLIIKNIPNFRAPKRFSLAFNAKKDFSDIPNFDLAPACAKILPDGNGNLRVELRRPLKKTYSPGTPTRLHSAFSTPMYYLASGWMPAGDGKTCVAVIKGILSSHGTSRVNFWKGTKYIRPFIWFGNWNRKPKKEARLLIDNISCSWR